MDIKKFFKNTKLSFILYTLSLIAIVPMFFLFFFNAKFFSTYTAYILVYIVYPLFTIGFILDIFHIIKYLWQTTFGKILYSILGYFSLLNAQKFSKTTIYFITNENPDVYQTSIQFISTLYLIPSWLISISFIIAIAIIISNIIMIFTMPFRTKTIIYYINKGLQYLKIDKEVHKNSIMHFNFMIIASFTFILNTSLITSSLDKLFNYDFLSKKILYFSYYPNKICKNIPKNQYIKFIDTDTISVTNNNKKINFFQNLEINDITFKTIKCQKHNNTSDDE